MMRLDDPLFTLLRSVDTPTVCNAIELVHGQRGFSAFTQGTMIASNPAGGSVVGYARTAKIAGREQPDLDHAEIRARRLQYFENLVSGDGPCVAIVEDTDFPHCVGAWWGEVHAAVHRGLGLQGAVTNGVMRDLGDLDPEFPIIAGSVGVSHGWVHVQDIGNPVEIFGLTIRQGDMIHADQHGALVVPTDVIDELSAAIHKLFDIEKIILNPARSDVFNINKLVEAWSEFEKARV